MEYKSYNEQLEDISNNLTVLIKEVKRQKLTLMATDKWTVKDVLCHIVFWHENYAANYNALANNQKPPLLQGPLYKLNISGVSALKKYSLQKLIKRLKKAQEILYKSIMEKKVPQMLYKEDGRTFETHEFLHLLARHIKTHTKHVTKAK